MRGREQSCLVPLRSSLTPHQSLHFSVTEAATASTAIPTRSIRPLFHPPSFTFRFWSAIYFLKHLPISAQSAICSLLSRWLTFPRSLRASNRNHPQKRLRPLHHNHRGLILLRTNRHRSHLLSSHHRRAGSNRVTRPPSWSVIAYSPFFSAHTHDCIYIESRSAF